MADLLGSSAYMDALHDARRRGASLRGESLRRLDRALIDLANRLTRLLAGLPDSPDTASRRQALQRALSTLNDLRLRYETLVEGSIEQGREVAFREILEIQQQATLSVAMVNGVPESALEATLFPRVTLAGAFESIAGVASWKTLLRGYDSDAVGDVLNIVTRAFLQGMSPDELGKRLRPYVLGAESLREAFRGAPPEITERLLNDPRFAGDARKLRHNADRIAFSEIQNARHEASLQAFAADPFVQAVRRQLSPNRGTQTTPDACDALAKTDFYGLGPGVYPVHKVPINPHPWCRCELVPVTRGVDQMSEPKPAPPFRSVALNLPTMPPTRYALIRKQTLRALALNPAEMELLMLAEQSRASAMSNT